MDRNEQPLVIEEREEQDPVTGGEIKITRYTRGLRMTETRTYNVLHRDMFEGPSTREALEGLSNYLRDQLERRGLPSDRTPAWIKIHDDWVPLTDENRNAPFPVSKCSWRKRIEALAEPLTMERAAADLLSGIGQILANQNLDRHLGIITQFASALREYSVLRQNNVAYQGVLAKRCRGEGPKTRARKGAEVRSIVLRHSQTYWEIYPAYRGQVGHTAEMIAPGVNAELLEKNLLPKCKLKLSVKTIGDHIRASFSG